MQQQVYVKGMTCVTCEGHVVKALSGIKGVKSVNVKWRKGLAVIDVTRPLSKSQVAQALEKADYTIGTRPPSWINRDRKVWKDFAQGLVATLVMLILLRVVGLLDFVSALDPNTSGQDANLNTILVVFAIGIVASMSTCMALVGGIILGVSSAVQKVNTNATRMQLLLPQIIFNIGRIVGFAILGIGLGTLGSILVLQNVVLTVVTVIVALIMLLLGVRLTEMSPKIATWQFILPWQLTKFFARETDAEIDNKGHFHPLKPLLLGVLTFFLPCGFTQAVQVFALATGSPIWAGVIMASFALGTTPGLLSIGVLGSFANSSQGKQLLHILGVVVIAFSLMNLNGAVSQYIPITTNITSAVSSFFESFGEGTTDTTKLSSNVSAASSGNSQTARIVVGSGYSPRTTVLQADTPTKLTFEKGGISCAGSINLSSLGISKTIRVFDSDQTVDVNLKPGTYNYSCSMGMYTGKVVAVAKENVEDVMPSTNGNAE